MYAGVAERNMLAGPPAMAAPVLAMECATWIYDGAAASARWDDKDDDKADDDDIEEEEETGAADVTVAVVVAVIMEAMAAVEPRVVEGEAWRCVRCFTGVQCPCASRNLRSELP